MNVFDEFSEIVAHLERAKIRYALVGGVAVALYTGQLEPFSKKPAIS